MLEKIFYGDYKIQKFIGFCQLYYRDSWIGTFNTEDEAFKRIEIREKILNEKTKGRKYGKGEETV